MSRPHLILLLDVERDDDALGFARRVADRLHADLTVYGPDDEFYAPISRPRLAWAHKPYAWPDNWTWDEDAAVRQLSRRVTGT